MAKTSKIILVVVGALICVAIVANQITQKAVNQSAQSTGSRSQDMGLSASTKEIAPSMPVDVFEARDGAKGLDDNYASVAPGTVKAQSTPRLVIKTGQISLVVKNVPEAVQKIISYANTHGGFVVSSGVTKTGIAPYATVTIRIPVDVFDNGLADVKALGEVQDENSSGQDVTDQYVDLGSRLKNLQATESQLLEIMRRALKITDVLAVQEQLTSVRGQIEIIQGQMKYLKESASMSSLTITLSTDPSALPVVKDDVDSWKPFAEIKNATRGLLDIAKSISYGIIWFAVYIPLWLLIILTVWIIVKVAKRFLKRNQNNQV